ncbi:V-type ATP synthase subunit A [Novipirellula artificiosorum]|uniref:V-type ATP synthase alpha chain n=1 Tax=Novipirellula artificiosorum TaxID=2528016 RepID=A0A5C6D9J2_9BACT|nr:V-type ATP synthase subunit A [Novipirellula artificiosorum]TWU32464.1 V-type sodium ATPase catalytic subunit A [Novipirellula artificiosorum]
MTTTEKCTPETTASVLGVNGNIVRIELGDCRIMKNEVAYVRVGEERLKAEVLRIRANEADLQVFEETSGVRFGDKVELSGEMLSVSLGPGLLGTVYDGLQNPLAELAQLDGFFLKRGRDLPALHASTTWDFTPACRVGDLLVAGQTLGTIPEKNIVHKIMVPFDTTAAMKVSSIAEGRLRTEASVATLTDPKGRTQQIPMVQTWPVRRPISAMMQQQRLIDREFPSQPLITTTRIIDTFFPIARGGTACIPGPFGAGKTVLQGLIARYCSVDVVIVVACGERAGEVVETIHDFAEMPDPRTGGKLMDRTIIICNTSSMPVAAREASIYTGITLGEYYRQMGLDVLLLADSTSRWAQAMRETSGRLEEIPGEEAFPAYLDSAIKELYERAGVLRLADGETGSLTLIGSVSPAGGNFEEPVTQSTLGTVKCFLGLSYDRAYKRFYPAIDPLISWSRYREQLETFFNTQVDPHWSASVAAMQKLLRNGESIEQMMQVTGEEGISIEDYVTHQKSMFLDMVYLQQDAYDPVDVSVSLERQREMFLLCKQLIDTEYTFDDKEHARTFFTKLTGLLKNLNTAPIESDDYARFHAQITDLATDVSTAT